MTVWTWIIRSLRYHLRQHLLLALGAALSAAVLSGALLTGEALRHSLARLNGERLGRIQSAVSLPGGVAPADLADRLERAGAGQVAPLLHRPGSLRVPLPKGESMTLARLDVYGCDERFFRLAREPGRTIPPRGDAVVLSRRVLDDLRARGVDPGAWMGPNVSPWHLPQLIVSRPALAAIDLPLGAEVANRERRLRVQPIGVLADPALGRFGLGVSQQPPRNLFLARGELGEGVDAKGLANLWVSDAPADRMRAALRRVLTPADGGLAATALGDRTRVTHAELFLPPPHVAAIREAAPEAVLATYHLADAFENEAGDRQSPYGFVAALSGTDDPQLGLVNRVLADD